MVLIVTDTGYVENKVIELQGDVSTEELDRISALLNQKLRGINLKDLRPALLNEIRSDLVFHNELFNEAVKLLVKAITNKTNERVFVDGATKILEQPEFVDIQKFKPLLNMLEEEERLYKLLSSGTNRGAQVKIGHENEDLGIQDCSVVTASYEIAGRTVGGNRSIGAHPDGIRQSLTGSRAHRRHFERVADSNLQKRFQMIGS